MGSGIYPLQLYYCARQIHISCREQMHQNVQHIITRYHNYNPDQFPRPNIIFRTLWKIQTKLYNKRNFLNSGIIKFPEKSNQITNMSLHRAALARRVRDGASTIRSHYLTDNALALLYSWHDIMCHET